METYVFAAVLFAAACHAGWNAVLKIGLDPFGGTTLIALGAAAFAVPLLFFVEFPPPPVWPWIAASVALHLFYYIGLCEAYRAGDMGQVYPIARGSAPLMTALIATFVLHENPGLFGWAGIIVLAIGIFLISFRGGDKQGLNTRAVGFALFTAATIACYSIVDGAGARLSGNAFAYSVALFVFDGLGMTLLALVWRGPRIIAEIAPFWRSGLLGGGLSFLAYAIVIWAMTKAPIALVAGLRETSVLFGSAIAVIVLREKLRPMRIIAACIIVAGLILMRLQP